MAPIKKIVVSGPFGAGKTTFVNAACPDAWGLERGVSDQTSRLKEQTTVALDHGTVRLPAPAEGQVVTLFGTPGQDRFGFMWPLLSRGMAGYVLVLDASRLQSQAQLKGVLQRFAAFAPGVPFVVAVNRWDRDKVPAATLAQFLGVPPHVLLPCDPRDRDQAVSVLTELVSRIGAPAPALT